MSNAMLIRYDAACRAVAECKAVDEIKDWRDKASALQAYARQAKNKQLEVDAAEIRIRAERRLGQMLAEMPKNPGSRNPALDTDEGQKNLPNPTLDTDERTIPTLTELGISYDLSSRAQAIASIPDADFEQTLAQHRDEQAAVTGRTMERLAKGAHQLITSSQSVEWYTPADYINAARSVMGGIDLDPASNPEANKVVQAGTYFTAEMNGLSRPWFGRVWLNPPYGAACAAFIERVVRSYALGEIDQAIVLVNSNSNDTQWFRPLWDQLLCFSYGRVNFYGPNGQESGPTHGSCFVYFGLDEGKFSEVFHEIGAVVKRA